MFLVFFCFFPFIPARLSFLSLSFISSTISSISFLPFSGRRHKMIDKGWRVVKPQHNQFFAYMWKRFFSNDTYHNMSHYVRKSTLGYAHPTNIQISLCIRAVWSESSLCVFWIAKDAKLLHGVNKISDQTARMRRLIWVFAGHKCQNRYVFSCCCSCVNCMKCYPFQYIFFNQFALPIKRFEIHVTYYY